MSRSLIVDVVTVWDSGWGNRGRTMIPIYGKMLIMLSSQSAPPQKGLEDK